MNNVTVGYGLIVAAAVSTITVPTAVDAVLFANAHMDNPAWLQPAKLHCAMSFFAAVSLGVAALALLRARLSSDTVCMGIAAFLATAF